MTKNLIYINKRIAITKMINKKQTYYLSMNVNEKKPNR